MFEWFGVFDLAPALYTDEGTIQTLSFEKILTTSSDAKIFLITASTLNSEYIKCRNGNSLITEIREIIERNIGNLNFFFKLESINHFLLPFILLCILILLYKKNQSLENKNLSEQSFLTRNLGFSLYSFIAAYFFLFSLYAKNFSLYILASFLDLSGNNGIYDEIYIEALKTTANFALNDNFRSPKAVFLHLLLMSLVLLIFFMIFKILIKKNENFIKEYRILIIFFTILCIFVHVSYFVFLFWNFQAFSYFNHFLSYSIMLLIGIFFARKANK